MGEVIQTSLVHQNEGEEILTMSHGDKSSNVDWFERRVMSPQLLDIR